MIAWQTNASFQQDRYDYAKNYHSSDLHGKYGTDGGVIPSIENPHCMVPNMWFHPLHSTLEYWNIGDV